MVNTWQSLLASASSRQPSHVSSTILLLGVSDGCAASFSKFNRVGLSYHYHSILSEDGEEEVARFDLWNIQEPDDEWTEALSRLKPDAAVLLLDWQTPWLFLPQIERYMALLMNLVPQNGTETRSKRLFGESEPGPGEFDMPISVPIVFCVQNTQAMETLEKQGWKDEKFDYCQQCLRVVALKYGAYVMYTNPTSDVLVDVLRHALNIGKIDLVPQVVEKDICMVPAGWDSWKKISILNEGFDADVISQQWSSSPKSVVSLFTDEIPAPLKNSAPQDRVPVVPFQEFLQQLAEKAIQQPPAKPQENVIEEKRSTSVGINVGGINMDADDLSAKLARLVREDTPDADFDKKSYQKNQNEVLADFFQRLLDK